MGIDKAEQESRKSPRITSTRVPSADEQPNTQSLFASSTEADVLSFYLSALATDDTGWLRISPADGGKLVYLKWKWTTGRLSNRYVMVVGDPVHIGASLLLLGQKKAAAENGSGRSSLDRYYGDVPGVPNV